MQIPLPPSHLRRAARVVAGLAAGLLAFLVLGNAAIAAAWQLQSAHSYDAPFEVADVDNLRVIDEYLWRGSAPSRASYRDLASKGATTIVDLRAEGDVDVDTDLLDDLGLRYVHIPIRDGQVPDSGEVDRFLDVVLESEGPTFVHCGAGVGRTGAMVAAYLVAVGGSTGPGAMRANLGVGPPSLEQLVFAASLDEGVRRPPGMVVAVSRVLDAPRRIWSLVRS